MSAITDIMFYKLHFALAHPVLSLVGLLLVIAGFTITAIRSR